MILDPSSVLFFVFVHAKCVNLSVNVCLHNFHLFMTAHSAQAKLLEGLCGQK